MKFHCFVNNSVSRLNEELGDERRAEERVTFLGIYCQQGLQLYFRWVVKHHLVGVISQVLMFVLFIPQ
jgi:hypothetical protein